MKISLTYLKNHLVCLGAAVFLLVSVNAAKAQILLTVNISDPSHVTITATNVPLTLSSTASTQLDEGIDLENFFQEGSWSVVGDNFPNYDVTGSSLTTADASGGPLFTQATADNASSSNVDLNLYQNDTSNTMTFTPGDAAFSGTMTIDFTVNPNGTIPLAGDHGTVVAGFSDTAGGTTPIGEWQVVTTSTPEPSTVTMLLGGLSLAAVYRFLWARMKAAKQETL